MNNLTFVTTNSAKVETLRKKVAHLGITVIQANVAVFEPQLDSIKDVAVKKARQAYETLKKPALVNDAGLTIVALNGFPGAYTKYVSKTIGNNGLLKLLDAQEDRTAFLEQTFCYIDGQVIKCFSDKVPGQIVSKPKSGDPQNKWGNVWDIFLPDGSNKTRSEMIDEEYFCLRKSIEIGSAWDELVDFLVSHNFRQST